MKLLNQARVSWIDFNYIFYLKFTTNYKENFLFGSDLLIVTVTRFALPLKKGYVIYSLNRETPNVGVKLI
jgi:hypothetical protein